MKTGSDGLEAIIRGRRISFAATVARMEDTRMPKCVMFGDWWGAWAASGVRKKRVERFLNDLGAFGINADQWTTAVQDKREWRKTAEQAVEHFMVK